MPRQGMSRVQSTRAKFWAAGAAREIQGPVIGVFNLKLHTTQHHSRQESIHLSVSKPLCGLVWIDHLNILVFGLCSHARHTPCTSPRGAVRLHPGIPEIASTARNHRRSAASHGHRQHGLGWWRHPWGREGWSPEGLCHHGCHAGGHRGQLGHLSDQPRGRGGEAKCAGGQGTRWEGSGQLRSEPVGAEARQWAH